MPQEDVSRTSQDTCTYIDSIKNSPQNFSAIEKYKSIWFIAGSHPAMIADNESESNSQEKDDGELSSVIYSSHRSV